MKISKIITVVLLSIYLLSTNNSAFAAKEAIFPNPKSLQPMPSPDVKPDISRNINSENVPIPGNNEFSQTPVTDETDTISPTNEEGPADFDQENASESKEIPAPSNNMTIYIILIVVLVSLVIYIVKQTIEKN